MNKWEKFKKFINDMPIGSEFTRKHMFKVLTKGRKTYTYDIYRQYLNKIGILKSKKPGVYEILYHIKKDVSVNKLKEAAYSDNWKSWFHDFKVEESDICEKKQ